jgi:hypothetical protein
MSKYEEYPDDWPMSAVTEVDTLEEKVEKQGEQLATMQKLRRALRSAA